MSALAKDRWANVADRFIVGLARVKTIGRSENPVEAASEFSGAIALMYTISTSIYRSGTMKLKDNHFLLACLIIAVIALNACGGEFNQPINLTPSLTLAAYTPTPATSTLTGTPTLTPTDWFIAMLTTSPTMYPIPTLPPDCGTVKLGSAGTQIIDNTQKILVQGTAILCGQIYFSPVDTPKNISVIEGMIDLDTGTFNAEDADIRFCPGGGSTIFYYFCDINDTAVRKYRFLFENGKLLEPEQPPFEECLGTKPYSGINDDEAKYACVLTNLGNISRVKFEQYDPLDDAMSVEISFITWEK